SPEISPLIGIKPGKGAESEYSSLIFSRISGWRSKSPKAERNWTCGFITDATLTPTADQPCTPTETTPSSQQLLPVAPPNKPATTASTSRSFNRKNIHRLSIKDKHARNTIFVFNCTKSLP